MIHNVVARFLERYSDDKGKNISRIARRKRGEAHDCTPIQWQMRSSGGDRLSARLSNGRTGADTPALPAVKYAAAADGMTFAVGDEQIHISVCRAAVVHFVSNPEPSNALRQNQPWMLDQKESCPGAKFQISQTSDAVILTTDALKIEFSLKWGNVQYSTLAGEAMLRERNSIPRTYEPVELNGEKTFHVEDRFWPDFSEGFYGLGQHQSGLFNYRGAIVELGQNNTDVAIPLLLSSKGYAILWNSASLSYVDNRFPLELNLRSMGEVSGLLLPLRTRDGPADP